jgi:Fanconi-associated nuclease 1
MDRFVQRCRAQPEEPPSKRPRLGEIDEVKDSDSENEDSYPTSANGDYEDSPAVKPRSPDGDHITGDSDADEDGPSVPQHQTAFESSLPAVATDKEAIEEYEAMRSSQLSPDKVDDAAARIDKRNWIRGNSSIYVDAFNLALDTVLEDETDLFDAKEKSVFEHWRGLGYEAQYLLVPRCLIPRAI